MSSLPWLSCTAVAGAFRSLMGIELSRLDGQGMQAEPGQPLPFPTDRLDELKAIEVAGPIPMLPGDPGRVYVPRPCDAVLVEKNARQIVSAVRPLASEAEFHSGYLSAIEDGTLTSDMRPAVSPVDTLPLKLNALPDWWPLNEVGDWLIGGGCHERAEEYFDARRYLHAPIRDHRTHAKIDAVRGAAEDSMLFRTTGLILDSWNVYRVKKKAQSQRMELLLRVRIPKSLLSGLAELTDQSPLDRLFPCHLPLGGENRLIEWDRIEIPHSRLAMPANILQTLQDFDRDGNGNDEGIRMTLVSPAWFSAGWHPGWLKRTRDGLVGSPPNAHGVNLKLVSATCGRWEPLSGWSFEHGRPKALRRLAPAGSTYFFTVHSGNAAELARAWFESVSDAPSEKPGDAPAEHDGLGLALWGTWHSDGITTSAGACDAA